MAAKAVYGIDELKMGAAGANGAMGSSLSNITKLAEGSVQFNFPEPTLTDITPEDDDDPFVTIENKQPKSFEFETLDLSLEMLQKAFGGAIATNKLTPGINFTIPEQSLSIKTRTLQGTSHLWEFPRCGVFGSIVGTLSKTEPLKLKFTVKVYTPVDAEGDKLASFTVTQA